MCLFLACALFTSPKRNGMTHDLVFGTPVWFSTLWVTELAMEIYPNFTLILTSGKEIVSPEWLNSQSVSYVKQPKFCTKHCNVLIYLSQLYRCTQTLEFSLTFWAQLLVRDNVKSRERSGVGQWWLWWGWWYSLCDYVYTGAQRGGWASDVYLFQASDFTYPFLLLLNFSCFFLSCCACPLLSFVSFSWFFSFLFFFAIFFYYDHILINTQFCFVF